MRRDGTAREDPPKGTVERLRPLSKHPELQIIRTKVGETWVNEYRVANFRTLESGRTVDGHGSLGLTDLVLLGVALWLAYCRKWDGYLAIIASGTWADLFESQPTRIILALLLIVLSRPRGQVYRQFLKTFAAERLKSESALAIPGVGVQLSTTRYLALPFMSNLRLPYSTSKAFIPIHDISSIVINEGLHRWSVRYFLAVIEREGRSIQVAFDTVTPRHAVLLEVYHGLRETLFGEWAESVGT